MSRLATIYVFADWKGLGGPTLMGRLHRSTVRGEEVLSFNKRPTLGRGPRINIDENNNACDLDLARSVGQHFRLSGKRQESIIDEVAQAIKGWGECAQNEGLKRSEIERMHTAFRSE